MLLDAESGAHKLLVAVSKQTLPLGYTLKLGS